jgi:hypothetical protein
VAKCESFCPYSFRNSAQFRVHAKAKMICCIATIITASYPYQRHVRPFADLGSASAPSL